MLLVHWSMTEKLRQAEDRIAQLTGQMEAAAKETSALLQARSAVQELAAERLTGQMEAAAKEAAAAQQVQYAEEEELAALRAKLAAAQDSKMLQAKEYVCSSAKDLSQHGHIVQQAENQDDCALAHGELTLFHGAPSVFEDSISVLGFSVVSEFHGGIPRAGFFQNMCLFLDRLNEILNQVKMLSVKSGIKSNNSSQYLKNIILQLQTELKTAQDSEEAAYEKLKHLRESSKPSGSKSTGKTVRGPQSDESSVTSEIINSVADSVADSSEKLPKARASMQKLLSESMERERLAAIKHMVLQNEEASARQAVAKLQQELYSAQSLIETLKAREAHLDGEVAVLRGHLQGLKDEFVSLEGRLEAETIKSERNRDAAATVRKVSNLMFVQSAYHCPDFRIFGIKLVLVIFMVNNNHCRLVLQLLDAGPRERLRLTGSELSETL